MALSSSSHQAFAQARRQTWLARLAGLAVLIAVAVIFWLAATYHTTVIKKEAPVSMLMPVQAPPPPPPPKEIKPQETETAPVEQPLTPTPQAAHDNALTQNAEAQIGGDAYGIGSGSGEGMRGAGVAGMAERGPYAAYMAQVIRSAANRNAILRGKMFKVAIKLWLTPAGKVTRAELTSSTGSDELDRELKSVLAGPPFDQAPPQSILDSLPVEMAVKVTKG
jgi:periplasmic protein TonB